MDWAKDAELRRAIEDSIRSNFRKFGSPEEAHMHYYNIFFGIYGSLYGEFESIKRIKPNYKQIDFIQLKGKILDYYYIVHGKQQFVRERYYKQLRERAEKQQDEFFQKLKKEHLEKEKHEYEELVKNGTNTPLDDFKASLREDS